MGTDKGNVLFAGTTMLEIATAAMAIVCENVTVVGNRDQVPPGVACIADVYPGCGPMGGIEAALRDCRQHGGEFAVFLPLDMPLLPGGLLRALTEFWRSSPCVRVSVTVADDRVQPLVSMIHVDVATALGAAIARGDHKLQPALRDAAGALAEKLPAAADSVFLATSLRFGDRVVFTAAGNELSWTPTDAEWNCRSWWFANLNTQAELQEALRGRERQRESDQPDAESILQVTRRVEVE